MTWSLKIAPAAAWIAMSLVASAAPLTSDIEIPTGDVWITPEAPNPTPAQTAQRTPEPRQLPTGDFWPAEEEAAQAAEAPPLPRDQSASREDGAVK